jgi:soluble lytic murein transglycosylase
MGAGTDGFVTGFARGFQGSYESGLKKNANRLSSLMDDFKKRQAEYDAKKEEDENYIRSAKEIAAANGGPEGSWVNAYQGFMQGRTADSIIRDFRSGTFSTPTPPSVDAQSEDLGLGGIDTGISSPDGGDLWSRVKTQESGNSQTNASGATMESPKGALGIAQVMPTTAMDPGFDLPNIFEVARNNGIPVGVETPDEAARLLAIESVNEQFGKSYFDTMAERYAGDEQKQLIAYNAGPDVADRFNGDVSTLPKETQGYLQNILGGQSADPVKTPVEPGIMSLQQSRATAFLREQAELLNVNEDQYLAVMRGYKAPDIGVPLSYVSNEDIPSYMDSTKINASNYLAFAEAAREAGNPDRAGEIEELGSRLSGVSNTGYLNYGNMTTSNAAGRLIAAQQAEDADAIETIQDYISTNDGATGLTGLTSGNMYSRRFLASQEGNDKLVADIDAFIISEESRIPASGLTETWVRGQYATLLTAATNLTGDAQVAAQAQLDNFEQFKLPAYEAALDKFDTDEPEKFDLESINFEISRIEDISEEDRTTDESNQLALALAQKEAILQSKTESAAATGSKPPEVPVLLSDGNGSYKIGLPIVNDDGEVSYTNSDGGFSSVRPIQPDELDKKTAVITKLSIPINTYDKNLGKLRRSMTLMTELDAMVEENPRVLTAVAGIATKLSELATELDAGVEIISLANLNDRLTKANVLKDGEQLESFAMRSFSDPELSNLVDQKRLFEAKTLLMGYRIGSLEGQSSTAMSNRDFQIFMTIIKPGNDGPAFRKNLSDYFSGAITSLADERSVIEDNAMVRDFKNVYGYSPMMGQNIVTPFDEIIQNTGSEAEKSMYARLTGGDYTAPVETTTDPLSRYLNGEAIVVTEELKEQYGLTQPVGTRIKVAEDQ